MRSEEARQIFKRRQLLEVICQLRFPDILKIESTDPAEFQDRIRGEYPQYQKKVEQLPPQIVNGKPVPQGHGQQLSVHLRGQPVEGQPDEGLRRPLHAWLSPLGGVCQAARPRTCRPHPALSARLFHARRSALHQRHRPRRARP